ncbi:MAG: GNAT family acetyltransferase [Spirochaetes bacterium GWD1_61_31]|nr:MAG: GNAT family acetyltransferase [Spirochaetes bacterium GWB1_60_80]OHD31668.1 MAG: GNAT family acetyltransferase [Spirochaetes bacterium GWC1_61_12]OHD35237.1 MAG: GNAT family acetyltransferase [Spirochaetes bacterium GWD1_61_31]OHD41465.1 MAG: GNAT family acetyltransferase [Spirochaetes bacterium GWE1_60_18]OHD61367.1 MAG: GNAT family acetyltransferase [Spirochaetes bacterium GWF1_60_12]
MDYRLATAGDLAGVLALQSKYHVTTIREADKKDGFVTTLFSAELLSELIDREQGLFLAVEGSVVLGYAMAASWQYWSRWPLFQQMMADLPNIRVRGESLTLENSYQYGPICIDGTWRGKGVLESLFERARAGMAGRYRHLVTFINQINPRSYAAHVGKLGLEVVKTFTFNGNNYHELVYDTTRPVDRARVASLTVAFPTNEVGVAEEGGLRAAPC